MSMFDRFLSFSLLSIYFIIPVLLRHLKYLYGTPFKRKSIYSAEKCYPYDKLKNVLRHQIQWWSNMTKSPQKHCQLLYDILT
jgi:hypothetical protein